jgi:hypothetical protein
MKMISRPSLTIKRRTLGLEAGKFRIDEGRVVENDRVLVYEINDGDVTLTVDGEWYKNDRKYKRRRRRV